MKHLAMAIGLLALALAAGCAQKPSAPSYTQITQEAAKEMMAADDGHVVLDVRRQDEFDAGHIPGAVCVPNESIAAEQPTELPDLDQVILIYCRSGNRSKQAAQKLADIGYTRLYEFGGIIDWTGEVVTSEPPQAAEPPKTAELSFETFTGGGPEFRVVIDDPSVLACGETSFAHSPEPMPGMGFTFVYTFTGVQPGTATVTVESRSDIAGNYDYVYAATVDEALNVTLEELEVRDLSLQRNGGA